MVETALDLIGLLFTGIGASIAARAVIISEIRGATVVEFTDGKISRNSGCWDLATYMKQIGLTK